MTALSHHTFSNCSICCSDVSGKVWRQALQSTISNVLFLKRSWGRSTSPNLIMQSKACSRYHIAKVATARWIPHTPSQLCAYWNSFCVDLSCVLTWSCNLFFRVLTYFCFVLLSLATSYAQKDINFNKWYICGVGFWSIEKQLAILCFSDRVT